MSAAVYFGIGALLAAYFGAHDDIEQGDYPKATALVIMCSLWPVALGLGVGLVIAEVLQFCRALLAKARGDQ